MGSFGLLQEGRTRARSRSSRQAIHMRRLEPRFPGRHQEEAGEGDHGPRPRRPQARPTRLHRPLRIRRAARAEPRLRRPLRTNQCCPIFTRPTVVEGGRPLP